MNPSNLATDLVKKILTVGIGGIFLTEESVRALISEFKLPKEMLTGVLENASRTKNEFLTKLSQDVIEKLKDRVDPQMLIEDVLKKHEIELNVRVKFHPKTTKKT
jgi:hypothetical protein